MTAIHSGMQSCDNNNATMVASDAAVSHDTKSKEARSAQEVVASLFIFELTYRLVQHETLEGLKRVRRWKKLCGATWEEEWLGEPAGLEFAEFLLVELSRFDEAGFSRAGLFLMVLLSM